MAQRAVMVGGVVLAGALLGASAPWSRALPPCSEVPAAQREASRLAGRCEGAAPVVTVDPKNTQGKTVREVTLPRRPVPELRGRPFNNRDERLAYYVVNVAYRESAVRRDWVIDQEPRPPATLPQGGNLRVVLSDGALVRVPDVRGNFARALVLLYRAGLSWSGGEGATGAVVGQQPAAGAAVRPGTQIALQLSPGPVALAPESTRPTVAPSPARTAPTPATTPSAPPAGSRPAPVPAAGTTPTTVPMPDVQGATFDAARAQLAGFNVQRVYRAGTEPGGTVIGQTPAAATPVAPGAAVRLVLSDGTLVRVPRVVSFTINEARQRLTAGELRPVLTNVASDARAGTVISQQPAEGEIAQRGSTIRLNISAGPATPSATAAPATVAVPNLVGSTFQRVQRDLDRFKVERSERAAREPVGTILEQSPAPGTQVAPDSALSIVVSSGGRPETIEVPNVVGQGAEAATSALSEFRLERQAVPSAEPAGRVLAQDPPPNAPAAPGSTVRMRVSDGSRVVAPSFAHMTLAQARDAAQGVGLALTLSGGSDDPAALVQRQEPAPGTEVARGSALKVAVEERALPFSVPSGVRDAWTRATTAVMQQSARNLVIALVVLLALLALLLSARRRGRTPHAPVEPVYGPTDTNVAPPSTATPKARLDVRAPSTAAARPVSKPAPSVAPPLPVAAPPSVHTPPQRERGVTSTDDTPAVFSRRQSTEARETEASRPGAVPTGGPAPAHAERAATATEVAPSDVTPPKPADTAPVAKDSNAAAPTVDATSPAAPPQRDATTAISDAPASATQREPAAPPAPELPAAAAPPTVRSSVLPREAIPVESTHDAPDVSTKDALTPASNTAAPPTVAAPSAAPATVAQVKAAVESSTVNAPDVATQRQPAAPQVVAAPPTIATPGVGAASAASKGRSEPASVGAKPGWFTRRKSVPPPSVAAPEPEPIAYGASARLDSEPNATLATNAMPRGPEIRIAARLEAGKDGYRELPSEKTTEELTEETK